MAVNQLEVFLASRFGEFADLRLALKKRINDVQRPAVKAVDLNDDAVDPNPPIARCYQAVDRAEIFVLLIGETYGDPPKDHTDSYTHLEYKRALEDPSKIILPFLFGVPDLPSDQRMRRWIEEVKANHTVKRLDPANVDRCVTDIFVAVLERLWEIADEGDTPRDDDVDDEEGARGRDESPIKRDELLRPVGKDDQRRPSRVLAADHAREAFEALEMNLTDTAIQQLRRSVDLAPLEIAPAYWLARLLIATGRFADCKEGLRLARRCEYLVAQGRDTPELARMASLILAARASERLEDPQSALEYAEAAHQEKNYHWLTKIELGRQLALNGRPAEALKYANEAFWLRADSIRKIQGDPAYRDIGPLFETFRRKLRETVQLSAQRILSIEIAIREVAENRLGAVVETPSDGRGRKLPLLRMVRIARLSAQRSLDLLQHGAKALIEEAKSFSAGAFNGITQETLAQISTSLKAGNENVTSLEETMKTEQASVARAGREMFRWATACMLLAVLGAFGILLAVAHSKSLLALGIGVMVFLVVAWLAVSAFGSRATQMRAWNDLQRLKSQLGQAIVGLNAVSDAAKLFRTASAALHENIRLFREMVKQFEEATAEELPFAPASTRFRAKASEIIRLTPKDANDEQLIVDRNLLPTGLEYFWEDRLPEAESPRFYVRRTGTNPDVYSRSAAYFGS